MGYANPIAEPSRKNKITKFGSKKLQMNQKCMHRSQIHHPYIPRSNTSSISLNCLMIGPPAFTLTCLLLALMGEEVRVLSKMSHSSRVWRRIARAAING